MIAHVTGSNTQTQSTPDDDVDSTSSPPSLRPSLSWQSFRSSILLSGKAPKHLGWFVAFLGLLFTVVALSPAFRSQNMTERALQLAEWTALKDFIEECREEIAAGLDSQACLRAMKAKIPPPPHVKTGILDRSHREMPRRVPHLNSTSQTLSNQNLESGSIYGLIIVAIFFATCILLSLYLGRFRASRLQHSTNRQNGEETYSKHPASSADLDVEPATTTTTATIRYPPSEHESSFRRRLVRTHPIYHYTTLDEAIHAADLSEIRMRLCNGEDVNEHWPYLIYRLAISPKAADMAKRIEVARLCLDFGADVNALKGWNGQTALLIAIHFGNVPVAKLLIANGAMVGYSPVDSHLTALHRCVRLAATGSSTDALEIMEMLCQHGADPNQVDRLNETPLHKLLIDAWYARHDEATFDKLFPVALCLIEHGADTPTSIKDKFTVGNPLLELVQAAIWERYKRITLGKKFKRERQWWMGTADASAMTDRALQLRS
ncbi:hypothetical protein ACN47E_002959 [Coniothyrium glycines]